MKKTIAAILCAAMLATALVGCSDPNREFPWEPPATTDGSSEENATPDWSLNNQDNGFSTEFERAFSAFAPDTAMITAGDYTVTWAELYVHLRSNVNNLLYNYGDVSDWSMVGYDDIPYEDMVLNSATDIALMFKAVDYAAKTTGVKLSEENLAMLQEDFASMADSYGGEEEFYNALREQDGIYNFELFEYLMKTSFLASILFEELYGIEGVLLTDEDVATYTAYDGYMMAKHILRLKTTEDGEDEALREAEDILSQLESYDGDDFGAFFDELMLMHTEDGGAAANPDGYLFQIGDMVDEFYGACASIDIGELSGVVESEYGYHIIYRLPIDYDVIPFARLNAGDYRSLRYITASVMFDNVLFDAKDKLIPEFTVDYYLIDVGAIFQ